MITPHAEGVTVAIRAQPGARKNGVQGEQGGMLKVAVTAPPEDGRANAAILEVLREFFGLKRSQVELLSGTRHRNKVVLLRDVTAEAIAERLKQ